MSEKIVPLVEQGSIIAFDTFKSFVNDAYQTVKPTVEMTFKTIQESTVVTTIKDHHITDIVIKIIKNDVMRPFKTIFAAVSGIATSRLSQSEIQKLQDGGHEWHRYVNTLNEKTGDLKSLWHGFAVDMVDVYLPVTYKYVQQGWSFVRWAIEIGAKEVRKQVIGLIELVGEVSVDGWSFVQSTNVFKTMRAHQVTQTMVDYYIMNKEYVDIAMEFGAKVWGHVIGFVDFCWMVLEGRISLWDQVFVSIELAREYVEEWYATLVQ
jgi:hypothetical protein